MSTENQTNTAPDLSNTVLAAVLRPKMASEALYMIEEGKEVEMETQYVFAFIRCVENHKMRNVKFNCSINKYNQGWTAISK